jgi:predicted ATPase
LSRFVIISGCSSAGKSTLLAELANRGYATVPEPGRRVVQHEHATGGTALPWVDVGAFVDRIVELAYRDYADAAVTTGWTFFDRGLIDALSALGTLTGVVPTRAALAAYPFHPQVFLAPPWPEIYETDAERKHGLAEAEVEYRRLAALYPTLGYETVLLPPVSVAARADYVERTLGVAAGQPH